MTLKIEGIHHTAISVRNLDASVKFYSDLGFSETSHYVSEDEQLHIVQLELESTQLEIFWYAINAGKGKLSLEYANNLEEPGVKHFGLKVLNAGDALDSLIAMGYATADTQINIARSLQDSRYFFVQDPDGMWVEIMEDGRK